VTGRPAASVQPTEEQAPGLRGLLVGVLQEAGAEGVPLPRFWQYFRRLHEASGVEVSYVKSRPLAGSKNRTDRHDLEFRLGRYKPDRTVVAMLRSYGTSLLALLTSLPYVEVRRGGRTGVIVALKAEFLQMIREVEPPGEQQQMDASLTNRQVEVLKREGEREVDDGRDRGPTASA
jgi:hypothetical protein